jgi:hypothetical protein
MRGITKSNITVDNNRTLWPLIFAHCAMQLNSTFRETRPTPMRPPSWRRHLHQAHSHRIPSTRLAAPDALPMDNAAMKQIATD